jgi:hypothetical protein
MDDAGDGNLQAYFAALLAIIIFFSSCWEQFHNNRCSTRMSTTDIGYSWDLWGRKEECWTINQVNYFIPLYQVKLQGMKLQLLRCVVIGHSTMPIDSFNGRELVIDILIGQDLC